MPAARSRGEREGRRELRRGEGPGLLYPSLLPFSLPRGVAKRRKKEGRGGRKKEKKGGSSASTKSHSSFYLLFPYFSVRPGDARGEGGGKIVWGGKRGESVEDVYLLIYFFPLPSRFVNAGGRGEK